MSRNLAPSRRLAEVRFLAGAALLAALAACGRDAPPAGAGGRPVDVVVVESSKLRDALSLSGEIQAQKDVNVAFRIGGRMTERLVNVGDAVKAGQVLARLDPATEQNALRAAEAAVLAALGEVDTARNTYARQQQLMDQGFTTRPRYDQARQALETAQARLEDAEARAETAQDRVRFTEVKADAAGIVTARGAEPGEVVQPGQMIVRLARDDGRDAVFEVPASVLQGPGPDVPIRIALAADQSVTAVGRVREVSPQADPVTRTFRVRVGLDNPPEAFRLGSTVNGFVDLSSSVVVTIPSGALTSLRNAPAVWVIDPASSTVGLRSVDVLRFEPSRVVISQGLEPGETIVRSGVQALHPGQKVNPIKAAASPANARTASAPAARTVAPTERAATSSAPRGTPPKEFEG
jgi:RND family efflux transporter MFP subunit